MQNHSRILDEVTRTSIELLLKEPFYAHLFSAMNKEVVGDGSTVKTMGIGLREKSYALIINSDFWENFLVKKQHRYGVLKHEVLHIIFKHIFVKEPTFDQNLLNIAMDLVVNQYILREQLPDESIFLETFPELNLEPEKSHRYYYDKLLNLQKECNKCTCNTQKKDSTCNTCDTLSAQNLKNIIDGNFGLDRHKLWGEIARLNKIETDILDAQLENLLHIAHQKTSFNQYSSLPLGVKLQIDRILIKEQPMVDWRRVLKLFAESSSKTRVKNTLKRPSKRFGTNPGIKIKQFQKLLVALDTSGSISQQEYDNFFSELYHIWKRGATVQVVECDTIIQHEYIYKGITPKAIHGGGGTDFNDPIRFANEINPDALIYFTDGFGPLPNIQSKAPILWVISQNGLPIKDEFFKKLPGRKAKLT